MSRAQRLTFLGIAVAIAVVAVIVLGSGGDEEQSASNTAATATATPSATAEPGADETATPEATPEATATPKPKPPPPLLRPGRVTQLRFKEGQTVVFRVRADGPEEIHVHGYDIVEQVGTDPVRVSFPARLTGIWEIEMHGSGELIAQLRVDPK